LKFKFTRRNQLWFLIGLSATTATAQYIVQGAMASGGTPSEFAKWFWFIDYALWGARALIEAWDIVYLFTTKPKTKSQSIALIGFEVMLIALITLTLGPTLFALTKGVSIVEAINNDGLLLAWSFGIAAYTSLMMGSAGVAYRIQPNENEDELTAIESELQEALSEKQKTHHQNEKLAGEIEALKSSLNGDLSWGKLANVLTEKGMKKGDVIEIVNELGGKAAWVSRGIDKTSKMIKDAK